MTFTITILGPYDPAAKAIVDGCVSQLKVAGFLNAQLMVDQGSSVPPPSVPPMGIEGPDVGGNDPSDS